MYVRLMVPGSSVEGGGEILGQLPLKLRTDGWMRCRRRTVEVFHDLLEALVLANLLNDLLDAICGVWVLGVRSDAST